MKEDDAIAVTLLMLYLYADRPSACQALEHNHYLHTIKALVQSSSTENRLLSKALIARMIPLNTANDKLALLTQVNHDEVHYLISVLESVHSSLPVISILMDLSRSPHNMWTFVSENVASQLSDSMNCISEEDQALAAQLIWQMMESDYGDSKEISAVINNGTLRDQCLSGGNIIAFVIWSRY